MPSCYYSVIQLGICRIIYLIIKYIKSHTYLEGKKRDGCAMKMVQPFFFWLQILQAIRCEGPFPTATPIKHKIPYSESENIRESNLDFTAHFGEINPDMLYLCRRSLSGPKKAVFAFFPSTRRKSIKKTLNLRFFAKKQVNF